MSNPWIKPSDYDPTFGFNSMSSGTVEGSPSSFNFGWNHDNPLNIGEQPTSGGSQWGNIFSALEKANSWKNKEEQSGYGGGFGQGFKGGPISGGSYQDLGKGKGIFQYQHAPMAGVIHPAQKQKSKGFFDRVLNAGFGFTKGALTGQPHMAGIGAAQGFLA